MNAVMRAACVGAILVAGACRADVDDLAFTMERVPKPTPEAEAADDQPIEPPATPTPEPTPTPTPTPDVRAIVTPTGIPVIVLATVDGAHVVRTPCGNEAIVIGGVPIAPPEVILDPGHGGEADTGAVGPNGLVEGDLDLDLAITTRAELESRGIATALTRTDDYLVPLAVRAAFADDLDAAAMVSIHHNAPSGDPSTRPGTEVFVQTGSDDSSRLGGLLYEEVTDALDRFDVAWTAAPDAGVLRTLLDDGRDAYGIIRRPTTPTALVELGYIANADEAELFTTDDYLSVASVGLADAVEAYLRTDRPGTGFGNPPRVFTPAFAPGADVCDEPLLG